MGCAAVRPAYSPDAIMRRVSFDEARGAEFAPPFRALCTASGGEADAGAARPSPRHKVTEDKQLQTSMHLLDGLLQARGLALIDPLDGSSTSDDETSRRIVSLGLALEETKDVLESVISSMASDTPHERQPSAGYERQPSAGCERQPSAGYERQPSAGYERQPSAGCERQPSAGYERQPSAGYERQPSAGCVKSPQHPPKGPRLDTPLSSPSASSATLPSPEAVPHGMLPPSPPQKDILGAPRPKPKTLTCVSNTSPRGPTRSGSPSGKVYRFPRRPSPGSRSSGSQALPALAARCASGPTVDTAKEGSIDCTEQCKRSTGSGATTVSGFRMSLSPTSLPSRQTTSDIGSEDQSPGRVHLVDLLADQFAAAFEQPDAGEPLNKSTSTAQGGAQGRSLSETIPVGGPRSTPAPTVMPHSKSPGDSRRASCSPRQAQSCARNAPRQPSPPASPPPRAGLPVTSTPTGRRGLVAPLDSRSISLTG
eukprot:TRINITY_DN2923_c0_g1_i3.p1 TRINITY_DN2923_c0_g1~~TRINITY_DN2923_c0_g1_i3.p1  ORF type:complete len:482 (+),score=61.82 TRINITY_DN2923_c0_g1_i3:81-1526(+)